MKAIKARGTSVKHGTYEFTKEELTKKGSDLAQALRDKAEAELDLKQIQSEYKDRVKRLELRIAQIGNDITTGERSGDMDCIVFLDERNGQFYKVWESKQYGHEVAAELFDFGKDQHLFDFETERDDVNGVKKVMHDGVVVMTVAYTAEERQMVLNLAEKDNTKATIEKIEKTKGADFSTTDEEQASEDQAEAEAEEQAERAAEEEAEKEGGDNV